MSNLIRSGWVSLNNDEKRIIDVNTRVAERISMLEQEAQRRAMYAAEMEYADADESDMDYDQEQALFGDEEGGGNIYREVSDDDAAGMEYTPDTEQMMAEFQQEMEAMRAQAEEEAERLRKQGWEEGRKEGKQQGYEMGYAEGMQQVDAMKEDLANQERQLAIDFENAIKTIEPEMVNCLTDIYAHFFGVEIDTNREIILHLLSCALHGIDSSRDFIVRVAPEEAMMVNMQKKKLIEHIPGATIEVVEDITMKKGDCIIETGGGIFDCGMDVELAALTKKLRLLAYTGVENNMD